jgi:hypothetical protein
MECTVLQGVVVKMAQGVCRASPHLNFSRLTFFLQMGLRMFIYGQFDVQHNWKVLDRDPTRFKLSEIETQRRRRLFWEVYISDMWIVSQIT